MASSPEGCQNARHVAIPEPFRSIYFQERRINGSQQRWDVGVGVAVGVGVWVGKGVVVGVSVGVDVATGVAVGVRVGAAVAVAVGQGLARTLARRTKGGWTPSSMVTSLVYTVSWGIGGTGPYTLNVKTRDSPTANVPCHLIMPAWSSHQIPPVALPAL